MDQDKLTPKQDPDLIGYSFLERILAEPDNVADLTATDDLINSELLKILLDYTAYSEVELTQRPNPYDDPYVGAVLCNEQGVVLGAHRKIGAQERHAEPNAIIAALEDRANLKNKDAADLLNRITSAYEQRIWLQSATQRDNFERLFKDAGALLRDSFACRKLILYSTLEPCRDYETQPSCACLICASGIDAIFYASDDTNAKGQGRQILTTGADPRGRQITKTPPLVRPNLATSKAIEINNLFFTSVHLADILFKSVTLSERPLDSAYATFRLDETYFEPRIVRSRLTMNFRRTLAFQINHFTPTHMRTEAERARDALAISKTALHKLSDAEVDHDSVIFMRDASASDISRILVDRRHYHAPLPGVVISTKSIDFASNKALKELLDRKSIRVYPNSFQKKDEYSDGYRHVLMARTRDELQDSIYCLAKRRSSDGAINPYASASGSPEECAKLLVAEAELSGIGRLMIFSDARRCGSVEALLRQFAATKVFDESGLLEKSSIEIIICSIFPSDLVPQARDQLRQFVEKSNLTHRIVISTHDLHDALSAQEIKRLIEDENIDPRVFSPDFLKELTNSVDWRDRKNAGAMIAMIASRERSYLDNFVLSVILQICDQGLSEENWATLCTYLNAVHDLPKSALRPYIARAVSALEGVAGQCEAALKRDQVEPWLVDVVWRWSACWCKITALGETHPLARWPQLNSYILSTPFLSNEIVYYTLISEPSAVGIERVSRFIATYSTVDLENPEIENSARTTVVVLARLATALAAVLREIPGDLVALYRTFCRHVPSSVRWEFCRERSRCKAIIRDGTLGLARVNGDIEHGKMFASLINIRALMAAFRRIIDSDKAFETAPLLAARTLEIGSWRGDRRSVTQRALAEIPSSSIASAVSGLVNDVDVATKWVGIAQALDVNGGALNTIISRDRKKSEYHAIRELRRRLVAGAIRDSSHYWITREVIHYYANLAEENRRRREEGEEGNHDEIWGMPPISTLGLDPLILSSSSVSIHPEVALNLARYRKYAKTIALVLPPISWPSSQSDDVVEIMNEGTPALGLGQIATALSAAGHFVKIFDAHRFNYSLDHLFREASKYDYVGVSVVISTILSTATFISQLSAHDAPPTIVIGGHAPTLVPHARLAANIEFDYAIVGPGEEAFLALIEHDQSGSEVASLEQRGVYSRKDGLQTKTQPNLRGTTSQAFDKYWNDAPWIERTLFHSPISLASYEPIVTRNGHSVEAHVVVSRGCNWGCHFCTEALIAGKHGENRRKVEDIIGEIRYLCREHGVTTIQFIDDNILPTRVPAADVDAEKFSAGLRWAQDLLDGLSDLRNDGPASFQTWRGLMRLEDYRFYEHSMPGFANRLAQSGCYLLAFGLETGSEDRRAKIKGGDCGLSNAQIKDLFGALRDAGIATKGYFMIGHNGADKLEIEKTIDVACDMNLALAYFAIYKDFRDFTRPTPKIDTDKPKFSVAEFLIESALSSPANDPLWASTFGVNYSEAERLEYGNVYADLKRSGFSFSKIFKYNDFHGERHVQQEVYLRMGYETVDAYLRAVRRGYLKFYIRDSWVSEYGRLAAAGW